MENGSRGRRGNGGSRRVTMERTGGNSWRGRETVGDGEESPRKRRKRSASLGEPLGAAVGARRVVRAEGSSDSGDVDEDEHDAEYSSALSSTRSSRQTSPVRRRNPRQPQSHTRQFPPNPSHTHTQSLTIEPDSRRHSWASTNFYDSSNTVGTSNNGNNFKKRKAPVNGATSDDDYRDDDEPPHEDEPQLNPKPEPRKRTRTRPRRNRNPALRFESSSPQTRKQTSRSSPSLPPNSRLSPTRITKLKGTSATTTAATTTTNSAGRPQRKIPLPVIRTTIVHLSDNSSSESESEPASRRRLASAARTPGSPISMSHKPKRDTAGRTHLHRACGRGAVAEVEAILEQSTELINAEDNAGYMPIHEASLNGHLGVVKVLVKYGAQYDVRSRIDLESPLLDAVENGHVPVIKYLIGLGANPTQRDNRGRTCLDANSEGDESPEVREEIEALLKAASKQRPVQRASDDENISVRGGGRDSPSSRDDSVVSPAHQSPAAPAQSTRRRNARAEQSRKDLLWLDSGKGSVIKLREKAREGDMEMVHALLETGLKPDTEALVGAIKGGHAELVSLLLAYQAEVDPAPGVVDREGSRRKREVSMPAAEETPMLAAIGRGNNVILRYLLENGADPLRKDSKGRTYPEIAREREGEYWQEEVALLQEAWQKAGGRSEAKSPSRHKSSPKARHPTMNANTSTAKQSRRNSSSNPSQSGRPTRSSNTDEKRSTSANPSHRASDLPTVSESESVAAGGAAAAKKRRRLVSGKVRDEEAARAADSPTTMKERDDERDSGKKTTEKPSVVKAVKTEIEDTIKVEAPPKKQTKQEPSEDAPMEDAPPLVRPAKVRSTRERRPSSTRSNSTAREMKRPASRTRSPPRAPRSDIERRQQEEQLRRRRREEHPDDRDRRRDSITEEPRRLKREESSKPPTPAAPEPPRRRDASTSSNADKSRPGEDDRRQRVKEREKEKRTTKEGRLREKGLAGGISQEQLQSEAREVLRKKHLIKELASIQKKALKESMEKRADEVINRELELRRLREEEERRQRIIREREEQEQEEKEKVEKEAREKAEKEQLQEELREKSEQIKRDLEAKRRGELERQAHAKAEAERIQKEAAEREARARQEREEQEREEREAREKVEREAKEKEERERQARIEEEARLEEERQREAVRAEQRRLEIQHKKEEAERQRLEHERLEQERRAAEEESKRRDLELEKARKEARDRKVAEELQQQITREQEALRLQQQAKEEARIQSLPHTLRVAAEQQTLALPAEDFRHFIPFFVATLPNLGESTPNGTVHKQERWVLNLQVALVLGTTNLELNGYQLTERRTATEHERLRMWSVLSPILCEDVSWSKKTMEERAQARTMEMEKYLNIKSVFWVKFSDIQAIASHDPRYASFLEQGLPTVEVAMDVPTYGKGSPASLSLPPSREQMAERVRRRFSIPVSEAWAKQYSSSSTSPDPPSTTSSSHSHSHSQSMPPPGIHNSSG
ncbi:hypothetical protein BZA05DRAFT_395654 [Tricharina praecox]|uniref:uncharacterized protein n=1 Tax=Tricharina praecox TaxID=43433 RepID=UPI00222005DD|nr:uncharacterized protein BZA05DRAFT_395654 [Tricharina praecox]KAI5853325.1 hypothetical protein BZA05DRAFT_395654 [Tricharina praecox]